MTRIPFAPHFVALLFLAAAPADARQAAQPDTSEPPVAEEASQDGDGGILAGPTVETDSERPETDMPRRRRFQVDVPLPYWFSTVRELDLDETQRIDIQEVMVEFQLAQRRFRRGHGGELRNLRRQVALARRDGEPVDPAKRKRLAELQGMVPQPESTQERIWEMLTPDQRDSMRATLEEIRARIAEQRAVRRDPDGAAPPAATAAPPGEISKRRLDFLRRHQSRTREGGDATDAERTFEFEEGPSPER